MNIFSNFDSNLKIDIMKSRFGILGLLFTMLLSMSSCDKEDDPAQPVEPTPPTSDAYKNLKAEADKLISSTKTFNAEEGLSFTSPKGVILNLPANALKLPDGSLATGEVTLEYKEIFTRGAMLTNNRTTMGVLPEGGKALLKSGGEFFINAKQGTQELTLGGTANLQVPVGLTGVGDPEMTLWEGVLDDNDNLAWNEINPDAGTNGGRVVLEGKGDTQTYYTAFSSFGWTNVDKFYSDPRDKTTLQVAVPAGYDNQNCAVYLSYDGEGNNALANLDTYSSTTKLFSEHYGQIPVGLEMHIIFATEEAGQWRYAIKAVTVAANDTYTFTLAETSLGTLAQVEAAINALP